MDSNELPRSVLFGSQRKKRSAMEEQMKKLQQKHKRELQALEHSRPILHKARYKKAVSTTRSRVDVQLAVSPTYRRRPPQQVRSIAFSSGNDSSVAPPQKQQKLTLSALDPSHGGRPRASHAQRPQNNSSKTTPAEGQQAETPFDLSKVQVSADGKVDVAVVHELWDCLIKQQESSQKTIATLVNYLAEARLRLEEYARQEEAGQLNAVHEE